MLYRLANMFCSWVVIGGPWIFIAPAAGFGLGLIADMKLMKHCVKEKRR